MLPSFRPDQIIIAYGRFSKLKIDDVIIIWHQNREKIKRIKHIDPINGVFVIGENAAESTDSRHFGWIGVEQIRAKVVWPAH